MSRNKVLERQKVSMPTGREPYDLSQERSFTSLAGEIDIAYCQPFIAGTKGSINRESFTRTAAVVSPAFHRVTEHYDFFVVPLHALWRKWENWKLNINDLQDTYSVDWDTSNHKPDLGLAPSVPQLNFKNLLAKLKLIFNEFETENAAKAAAREANNLIKLVDQLRLGVNCVTSNLVDNKVQSLFMVAAYQKCYFDHYRNTAYEANNPYAYNLDWLDNGGSQMVLDPDGTATDKDTIVCKELFKIRNVNYRNDYFHNIYPALNYVSNVGGQPSGKEWTIPSDIGGAISSINNNRFHIENASAYNDYPSLVQNGGNFSNGQFISAQSIRALFALDRLTRAAAYAPKHVRDQYKALYGVEGVEDFDMKSERIGSFQSQVAFEEVTNMAGTSSNALGELGAKGKGGSGKEKPLNFYCKYDSIVIGLHYFLPRARYDAYGIHPWNTKLTREDFYIKAFENLGLRPMLVTELQGSASANMLAWTVPNHEYKILPDLNFGPFKQEFQDIIVTETDTGYQCEDTPMTSELMTFVPHTQSPGDVAIAVGSANASYFKVYPEDLDNVFAVAVPATHPISYYQFFGEMRISVAVVAPMSCHGQPIL